MGEDKSFQLALLVSILFHFTILLASPGVSLFPSKRSLEPIKIFYCKIKEPPKKLTGIRPESIARKLPEVKKEEILSPPKNLPTSLKTREAAKPVEEKINKDAVSSEAVKNVKEKKFEAVVQEERDSAKKAAYISYYRAVREKIKECADRNYPKDRSVGEGSVYLSFTVASNGELLQVMVHDNKSTNDAVLKSIALNSIRDSNPFSPFPQGMSHYQITFNVIISFELNK